MDAVVAGVTNGVVINTFFGDPEIIEFILGPDQFDELVVESEETHQPFIGGTYDNGKFYPLPPYPDWVFDEEHWMWVPPIPFPAEGGGYTWDQETHQWIPDEVVPIEE